MQILLDKLCRKITRNKLTGPQN